MKIGNAIAVALVGGALAARASDPPGGNIYNWPDLGTGMWAAQMVGFGSGGVKREPFPLSPAASAARNKALAKVSGSATCDPIGPLGLIGAGFPLKFYFTPGEIVMMTDMDALWVRHIYMDGRQHHILGPSYEGYSVGHWDGNSLIVDTSNLNGKVNLTSGVPTTPTSHIVERYQITSSTTMLLSVTIADPAMMTKPYSFTQHYVNHKNWEIQDTFCGEGNRDAPDASGDDKVDLTPPGP